MRVRRFDFVTLLLDWGADPNRVDLDDLFGTYNSELFERFHKLGVDLVAQHAVANAIAYHTSNKPLLGSAKRHRLTDSRYQRELDIALAHHAAEGNEKGVQLCLWAGANPHSPVPSLRLSAYEPSDDDEDSGFLCSAISEACQAGRDELLKRLRPDPAHDDMEELWRVAASARVIDLLAPHGLPTKAGPMVEHHLWWAAFGDPSRRVESLRRLFEVGVRWTEANVQEIASLRRSLLKAPDRTFVDLITVLATGEYCSDSILKELARTPSMVARMKKVGFIPSHDDRYRYAQLRPTRSREILQRLGMLPPKRERPKAASSGAHRSVRIGRPKEKRIELSREELFERVWSRPVATVAKECGLSGPGLKKICVRLSVPVPPRGYWAKLNANKSVGRARLPALSSESVKGRETS